jgi:hypothetical protein
MATVRERWFSRRAFLLHFLLVTVTPGCLLAGWWQVHRALSGNLLSYFYSVEWPIFAVLAVVAWWQLIHDRPGAWKGTEPGAPGESGGSRPGEPVAPPAPVRKSWLYRQDETEGRPILWDESFETPELAEYNRYLRSLAAGKAKKTWANPRGLPTGTSGQASARETGDDALAAPETELGEGGSMAARLP